MKRLLLLLLLMSVHCVVAEDYRELQWLKKDLDQYQESSTRCGARVQELRAQIKHADPNNPETGLLHKELEEYQEVISATAKTDTSARARVRVLEERLRTKAAIGNDRRRPTKADISGGWMTASPGLIGPGYLFRLEQHGEVVSGQGFFVGCSGTSDLFEISGVYKGETLTLTYSHHPPELKKEVYRFAGNERRVVFEIPGTKPVEQLVPVGESSLNRTAPPSDKLEKLDVGPLKQFGRKIGRAL